MLTATYSIYCWDHDGDGSWSTELAADFLERPATGLTLGELIVVLVCWWNGTKWQLGKVVRYSLSIVLCGATMSCYELCHSKVPCSISWFTDLITTTMDITNMHIPDIYRDADDSDVECPICRDEGKPAIKMKILAECEFEEGIPPYPDVHGRCLMLICPICWYEQ